MGQINMEHSDQAKVAIAVRHLTGWMYSNDVPPQVASFESCVNFIRASGYSSDDSVTVQAARLRFMGLQNT